jgi:hypothetical protein
MKKKLFSLSLLAIVGTIGISLSSFLAPSEDTNHMQTYRATCNNGAGVITVCGADGSGCEPSGSC